MSANVPEYSLIPRQQMGLHLKQLREAAGMLSRDVAAAIGISADLASRLELGERWPKPEVAKAWLRVTRPEDDHLESIEALLTELKTKEVRLRSEAQGPKLAQDLRSDLFRRAKEVRTFATTEIPFYLQTVEYARQEVGDVAGAADVVVARRAARDMVGTAGKYFRILMVESALRLLPCDTRAMRRQLSDLQGLIGAPGVEFGIIPFGAKVSTPLLSAFNIFDEITVVESYAGAIDLTPKSVGRYIELMDRLWDDSVRGEKVRELLTAAANALPAA